jgi:hypothetical protein
MEVDRHVKNHQTSLGIPCSEPPHVINQVLLVSSAVAKYRAQVQCLRTLRGLRLYGAAGCVKVLQCVSVINEIRGSS